jgi:predicted permease
MHQAFAGAERELVMRSIVHDLRYALRQLRRSPGFTLTAVLTLALGIGVNAAMFTLTYAIMLKSLPVPDPGRLIRYNFKKADMDIGFSGPLYDALRKRQTASTDLLAWSPAEPLQTENGSVRLIHAGLISGNGFSVLQLKPILGRVFSAADDVTGGGPNGYQAVLNYGYWQSELHGDPAVIGRSINLNGRAVSIVGVLPRGFDGLIAGKKTDVVLPLAFVEVLYPQKQPYRDARGNFWLTVMGRLREGQTLQNAQANLHSILPQAYAEADPDKMFLSGFFKSFVVGVENGSGGRSDLRTVYSQPLLLLELLSGLLLLLCCANIGLLMLSRAASRQHELAVRSVLGASGARIVMHVLLEVLLFVPAGVAGGIVIGAALARMLASMLGHIGQPSAINASPGLTVVLFSSAVTVATALLAGLWPALRMRRIEPAVEIKQGSRSITGKVAGGWIIPVQVAVSVTLLVAALLLGSTFARLYLEPSGFQGKNLVFADVDIRSAKLTGPQTVQAAQALLANLQSEPGIESAALMSEPPLRGISSTTRVFSFDLHGAEHSDTEVWPEAVSATYFETMGTKILEGRALAASDLADEKVCVLSRSAADFFFPGEDAVGRTLYEGGDDPSKDAQSRDPKNARRVVGIAEDAHFFSLRKQPDHILYSPLTKEYMSFGWVNPAVRSASSAVAASAIRDALKKAAPAAPAPIVYTYSDLLNDHLQKERMLISLSSSFAGIALVLIAVGLFGILMRSVTQRTREIGIRMALGEQRGSVVRLVLLSALKRVLIGVAAGSALAYVCSRLMRALLYQTSIASPWVYAVAGALLLVVAVCAALLPARRAAAVDPILALRSE